MDRSDIALGRRSLLKTAGVGVLGSTLLPAASAQEEKGAVEPESNHQFRLENDDLYLIVSTETGQFRLWTADDQALLFPTSALSIIN